MDSYIAWFDDDRKKTSDIKIQEAMAAYERRTGKRPNIVLINEQDQTTATLGVRLRPFTYVRPSTFYVGFEEVA